MCPAQRRSPEARARPGGDRPARSLVLKHGGPGTPLGGDPADGLNYLWAQFGCSPGARHLQAGSRGCALGGPEAAGGAGPGARTHPGPDTLGRYRQPRGLPRLLEFRSAAFVSRRKPELAVIVSMCLMGGPAVLVRPGPGAPGRGVGEHTAPLRGRRPASEPCGTRVTQVRWGLFPLKIRSLLPGFHRDVS